MRKYLFSQTEFAGDRFSYHGNARELMNGALKATLVFGLPYYGLSHAGPLIESGIVVNAGLQIGAWLLLLFFIPVAIVGARRYRLTRTSWRGIRFSFQGKTWDFIKLWLSGYALTGLSLGLYYPYFSTRKETFLTAHSYFGNEPFGFTGDGARLFRRFLMIYFIAAHRPRWRPAHSIWPSALCCPNPCRLTMTKKWLRSSPASRWPSA